MAQMLTLKLVFAGRKSNLVVIFPLDLEIEVGSSVFISGPNLSIEGAPEAPKYVACPLNSICKRDITPFREKRTESNDPHDPKLDKNFFSILKWPKQIF